MRYPTEFNPRKVDALLFNGTDTYFQPSGYCLTYPTDRSTGYGNNRSETISFLATCITKPYVATPISETHPILDTKTQQVFNGAVKIDLEKPLDIKLIEGPDTRATNTHEKIALGVASRLGAILEGKNIFNIGGHSRGAVEAILVAWELQRIKDAMLTTNELSSPEEIWEIICGNPDEPGICASARNVRNELRKILVSIKDNRDLLEAIRQKFIYRDPHPFDYDTSEILVNLFLIDPVPGNDILKARGAIGWTDPHMFEYPALVRNVTKLCCKNEDSACFDLLHTKPGPNTIIRNHVMPGHHGTLTGNPFGNNGESLLSLGVADGLTAEDAQLMAMYMAIDFFTANGSMCKISPSEYPLTEKYNTYITANDEERARIRLETYQKIHRNIEAYNALNKTVYISIGWDWHEAFTFPYEKTTQTRPMIIDAQNNKSNMGAIMPFNSRFFINQDHLNLFLQVNLGLNPSLSPEGQLAHLLDASTTPIYAKINEETNPEIIAYIEEAISNTISSLVQEYIKNNLPEARKSQIIATINRTLSIEIPQDINHVKEEETKSETPVANYTNLGKIKDNLRKNLEDNLIQQIELQVQAYHDSLENMIRGMHKYDAATASLNSIIYIEALDKFQQLKYFTDNLSALSENIEHHPEFKQNIQEKVSTIKDYAIILPNLIANILVEKNITLPKIDIISDSTEERRIAILFYKLTNDSYNCLTDKHTEEIQELFGSILELRNKIYDDSESMLKLRNKIDVDKRAINEFVENYTYKYCNMQVLSGFILAIGSLAVAAAFTVLALHALGIFASAGVGASGLAIIAIGIFANRKHAKLEAFSETIDILNSEEPSQQLA